MPSTLLSIRKRKLHDLFKAFLRTAGNFNFNESMFPFRSLSKLPPTVRMMSCIPSSVSVDSVAPFNDVSNSVLKISRNLLISC